MTLKGGDGQELRFEHLLTLKFCFLYKTKMSGHLIHLNSKSAQEHHVPFMGNKTLGSVQYALKIVSYGWVFKQQQLGQLSFPGLNKSTSC